MWFTTRNLQCSVYTAGILTTPAVNSPENPWWMEGVKAHVGGRMEVVPRSGVYPSMNLFENKVETTATNHPPPFAHGVKPRQNIHHPVAIANNY